MSATDTIVALSTPPGRSGIGVIRLSGDRPLEILRILINDSTFFPNPGCVLLKRICEPDTGALLDEALVTFFNAPHSFTGQDVVELSCHGSPVLLRQIVDVVLSLDARLAGPGEFTLRAVLNGKLNLDRAEAIRDLINAQTTTAARQAARQIGGELSTRLQWIKDLLIDVIVVLESSIEFVEEDLPEIAVSHLDKQITTILDELQKLSATFKEGRLLKDGLNVALVGRPNVGKSSLFNRLLSFERAIVTDIAGTTRDSLTEVVSLRGIPVMFTDTAGMRASEDKIESLGVERTRQTIADADLVVVVLDGSQPLTKEDFEILSEVEGTTYLIAANKMDLDSFNANEIRERLVGVSIQTVSAKFGSGLSPLRDVILAPFASCDAADVGLLITDARHFDLLQRAGNSAGESSRLFRGHASEELVLVGLHDSLRLLGEITGETTSEDILSRIFAKFCIGK
jgi:tRNA modification GTPase